MKVKFKVEGLREFDEALGELSKGTARNVLIRVLKRAAQPMADMASGLAPDDPNTAAPDLHTSIVVSTSLKNSVGNAEYHEAMQNGGTKAEAVSAMRDARREGGVSFAEVYVGPTADMHHAHLQEHGTVNHPPQAFMRPAFDAKADVAIDIIKSDLGKEIEKAAERARRRAAKKAGR